MNLDQTDILAKVEDNTDIANWSEARQNEFVGTFHQRSRVTRYILIKTANRVWELALKRHFISSKHTRSITKGLLELRDHWALPSNFDALIGSLHDKNERNLYHHPTLVGGREVAGLNLIADERAKQILANLPPLSKAVEIIDVETSRKIDRKLKIEAEGETLREKLEEVCGVVSLSDQDPEMKIGAFLAMVQDREDQRQRLIKRMNALAIEGQRLESEISKTLFAGLPGLSDAVVEVIRNHVEQSIAFEQTGRRVEEQVKFGQSAAAVELLRHFEKDEVKVSDGVKEQFAAALEKLKVSKKPTVKPTKKLKR
jgi:hypothetical protein